MKLAAPFVTPLRRLVLIVLAALSLLSLLAFTSTNARADETTSCSTDRGSTPLGISGALFSVRQTAEGSTWNARYILDVDATFDFCGGTITFAQPLPAGERLLPSAGIAEILDGDVVVGVRVDRSALVGRSISASFRKPGELAADGSTLLGAPIAASEAVQIVQSSASGTRIELARSEVLGRHLRKHLGYIAPDGVGAAAREEARRLVEVSTHLTANAIYVRGQDIQTTGGLRGHIVGSPAQSRRTAMGIVFVFATVVVLLGLAARKLREVAAVEHAEAMLAGEIDAIAKDAAVAKDMS